MGETFRIGFVMARRGNYNAHLARTFTVTMGGQNLGVYSPMTTAWEQALTAAVVANAASLQLVLEAGAEPGNDSMALIDDVAVMPAHPHAARAMGNGNSFEYDANGNMTVRREKLDGISYLYTQTWTIDNRLASVTKTDLTGTVLAVTSFYYDGDGVRVRKDDPDGTTLYAGPVEQTIGPGGTATAEYFDDISGTSTLTAYVATRNETVTAGLQQTFTVPPTGLGSEPYGVRYQIWLTVPVTDTYTFAVYADDGFSFNGNGLSLSNGTTRAATTTETTSGAVMTPGNVYNFSLAYFNYTTATVGNIQLLWRRSGGALEIVPREAIHARGRRDYYSFGGAVVAMKEGVMSSATRTLTYLHGDHLGSASLTTNISGTVVSQQRYKPGACPERQRGGEVRWASGAGMPTDRQFTSQTRLSEGYVGTLYDYVARAYDPVLGRFISADTIVPGAGNPAALNRYMYVLANPLGLVDPSGHAQVCAQQGNLLLGATLCIEPATGETLKWETYLKSVFAKSEFGREMLAKFSDIFNHILWDDWMFSDGASRQSMNSTMGKVFQVHLPSRIRQAFNAAGDLQNTMDFVLVAHEVFHAFQRMSDSSRDKEFTTIQMEREATVASFNIRLQAFGHKPPADIDPIFAGMAASRSFLTDNSGILFTKLQYALARDGTKPGGSLLSAFTVDLGFSSGSISTIFQQYNLPTTVPQNTPSATPL